MPAPSSQTRRGAFTLLEAMVVVAIIGISAALAAPSVGRSMADRRVTEASAALIRLGARARSEAMVYGRAHVMTHTADPNAGRVELWRGRSNLCNYNDWATIMANPCADSRDCVESLDMLDYDFGHYKVRMVQNPSTLPDWMCFQPDGNVLFSTGSGSRFYQLSSLYAPSVNAEGIRFSLQRREGGTLAGVVRTVVFPLGGTPRVGL